MGFRTAAIMAALAALVALPGCGASGLGVAAFVASKPTAPGEMEIENQELSRRRSSGAFTADPNSIIPGGISGVNLASEVQPPEPGASSIPPSPATHPARIIIYSGSIHMVVSDINSTIESIKHMALSMGGYLQNMDAKSITVRIPADKFDQAFAEVQRRGELVDKQIKAADVTEEMQDLGIRLGNARQTRQQLLGLLDKSTKMEDTLKIEAELQRVTEQLELLEGKLRLMQEQVAFSLLRVELNSPVPQAQLAAVIPFPWVRELGQGAVTGGAPEAAERSGWFGGGVKFDLPGGYILFYQHDDLTEAMSADGVMIKATRHDNYKGGDIKFWSTLARRALLNNGSISVKQEAAVKPTVSLIEGVKALPGGDQGYLLMVIVSGDHVETYEAWGPKALVERDHDILQKAGESLGR